MRTGRRHVGVRPTLCGGACSARRKARAWGTEVRLPLVVRPGDARLGGRGGRVAFRLPTRTSPSPRHRRASASRGSCVRRRCATICWPTRGACCATRPCARSSRSRRARSRLRPCVIPGSGVFPPRSAADLERRRPRSCPRRRGGAARPRRGKILRPRRGGGRAPLRVAHRRLHALRAASHLARRVRRGRSRAEMDPMPVYA